MASNTSRPDPSTTPDPLIHYDTYGRKSINGATFCSNGTTIVTSVRRAYPMIFNIDEEAPLAVCSAQGYRNSCTLKNIAVGGPNADYIVSGSDDFCVYMWRLPNQQELDEVPLSDFMTPRIIGRELEPTRTNEVQSTAGTEDSSSDDSEWLEYSPLYHDVSGYGTPILDKATIKLGCVFFLCFLGDLQ
jgi:hypothetical protein